MTDFDAKFKEMQKYLPFLKNVIEKLRSSSEQGDDNPRRAQLKKMEVLHDLLKSNGKKLKMETLLKCEGLLIKLHSKMVRIPFLQSESETSRSTMSNVEVSSGASKVSNVEIVDITGPESPPPQQLEEEPPVEIPTERRSSPAEGEKSSRSTDSRDRHKHCSKPHKHHHHHHSHSHSHGHSHSHHHERHQQPTRDDADKRSVDIFNRRNADTEESSKNHVQNCNRNPRSSSTPALDIYSPEECWDEVKNHNKPKKSTTISTILTTSHLDDDDDNDSPTQQAYHDTIFNFKKQMPKSNEMFSRIRNPEPSAASTPAPHSARSAPISIPIKVPTIPDVLKSPPLSASDISDLLNESDDTTTSFKMSIPSIAEIGTRRPGKSTTTNMDKTADTVASNLDKVRKKFAIVTQSSPQNRSSPDMLKSPIPTTTNDKATPMERIALKYHPHQRTERNSQPPPTSDPRMNPNRLSNTTTKPFVAASPTYQSSLPQDPRLRKAAEISANSSLYQQPHATSHSPAPQNFSGNATAPPSRIEVITTTQAQLPPMHAAHIPSIVDGEVIPPRRSHTPLSFPVAPIDPRQYPSSQMPINQSSVSAYSHEDFTADAIYEVDGRGSPQLEQVKRAERAKSHKSGNISDENWDSDTEAPAVMPKTVPQAQNVGQQVFPRVGPKASRARYVDRRVVQQSVPQIVPPVCSQVGPLVKPRAVQNANPCYPGSHMPINQSPGGMNSHEDFPANTDFGRESPQLEQVKRAELIKSKKDGNSSEENWDSDPETSTVMPKAVPQSQKVVPQVSPRAPHANIRVVPETSPRAPHVDPRVGLQTSPRVPHVDPRVGPQTSPRVPHVDPRVGPQTSPRVPHVDPRAVPPVSPRVGQQSMPHIGVQLNPQISPRVMPQANPRIVPPVDARAIQPVDRGMQHSVPQIVPPVNPQAMPRVGPQSVPQGMPHIIPQNRSYVPPQDGHMDGGFRALKTPLLSTPSYSRINAVNSVPPHMMGPHMHQHPTDWLPNPNLSNFSALLNDNTERSKYFESKKQKHYQPRTYMEYKQAKARAAAEEAARRAAEDAAKLAAEVSKDIGEVSEVDSSVLAKLAEQPPAASTLDKLYRSTNFSSCDFPKAKTSFKIPKKIVEKVADHKETATEAPEKMVEAKEGNSVRTVVAEEEKTKYEVTEKLETMRENSEESTQVQAPNEKKNTHAKDRVRKKDKDGISEKKEMKKKQSKESAKKDGTEISKKSSEKIKRKSVNKTQDVSTEVATVANTQAEVKETEAKTETKAESPPKTEPIAATHVEPTSGTNIEPTSSTNIEPTTKGKVAKAETDAKTQPTSGHNIESTSCTNIGPTKIRITNTDPRLAAAKRAEENKVEAKTDEIAQHEVLAAEAVIESQAQAQSGPPSILAKEEGSEDKHEANATQDKTSDVKDEISVPATMTEFMKQLESPKKPARILKRRNTMIVRGSLPEFDKEIFTVKSLVYEDIQGVNEEERRKELDAKLPKMNRSLAEIFQKTDDNCKVSTQNIISGKRRTRTNINFNEVKRSQEIYRANRRSEPAKPTVELAPPMAKKNTPKVKKGAKGKLKGDGDDNTEAKPESVKAEESSECEEDDAKLAKVAEKSKNKSTSVETTEKSAKAGSRIDTLMDEDAQKRHLLESFVQDILNPKKDKAQIFGLLSQILSEENLKFVKEIVESTAEKNAAQAEETNDDGGDEAPSDDLSKSNKDEEDETKYPSCSKSNASVKKKPPASTKGKKKKNELDRLNEDIRTMFISRGVLTATGRRMCTLVAAVEQGTNSKDEGQAKPSEKVEPAALEVKELKTAKVKPSKNAPKELPRLRRAKVILEPINVKEIQKRVRMQRMAAEAKKRAKDAKSDSETEDITTETPPRKMPVLKPHTPIKQSEVEDDDATDESDEKPPAKKIKLDVKGAKKVKPGPKSSKKPKSALLSDDEEEDKASVASEAVSEKTQKTAKKTAIVKNTNKEWHSQSKWTKWCMICDKKVNYVVVHFKQMHKENFISRLSPDVLDQLKVEGSKLAKPYFSVNHKKTLYWSYHCPFCKQHNRTIQQSWVDHFITHTGEYPYECSKCQRPTSKMGSLDVHMKTYCPGATVVRKPTLPMSPVVRAHVCHLCNYIQLQRNNLDSHLVQQHGITKAKSTKLGYTIDLFDTRDVEVVSSLKAVELEEKILNAGLHAASAKNDKAAEVEENNKKQTLKIKISKKAEECNASLTVETCADNETESSDDSDDNVPISKAVQRGTKGLDSKKAVDNALNSNIFVPTRETSDSPTMNNLAQSLFKMSNEQTDVSTASGAAAALNAARVEGSGASARAGNSGGISIAERLSQKFKNIKSGEANSAASSATPHTPSTTATHESAESSVGKAVSSAVFAQEKPSNECAKDPQTVPKEGAPVRIELNSSPHKTLSTTKTSTSLAVTKEKANTVASEPAVAAAAEDDDENWEDIEITESAPSKTTSSALSKQNKSRNKNALHKLNRLYVTNNKLKKSISITIGSRKKASNEERKELEAIRRASNETTTSSIADKMSSAASTTTTISNTEQAEALMSTATETSATPMSVETNLGFRPLITNLADLLPDSPCNDPIELVPELTPIESLQDLCDVSSILNSEYISTNWQQNLLPLNMTDSSQQVSMQEALDFVHEQQQQLECEQNTITTTTTVTNAIAPLGIASIQRIHNIGYSKSVDDNRFKFYCLSENCTFLYSNEVIGLESHFICEHSACTWNGYCQTCKLQVEGIADADVETKLPLSAELKHMRNKHLTNVPVPTAIAVTASAPTLPTVEELKQPSASNSPSPDDDRPRIKIRRLTGDCLSTTTPPTTTTNSKSITAFDENAQLIELSHTAPTPNKSITTSFLNKLPTAVAEQPQNVENRHFQNIGAKMTTFSTATHTETAPTTSAPKTTTAPPCQIQISSVMSLKEQSAVTKTATPPLQLPVISNVCSLNVRSVSSPVNNTGALWAQHIAEERAELERSAAESMEITRIINDRRNKAQDRARHARQSNTSDSPEPQVVAETLPVTQSTSGNYLITQTVSAQYEEGRLGFNISIANNPSARQSRSDSSSNASNSSTIVSAAPQFKCMANGCKYQTRLPLAMGDHLLFHDRQNFSTQREYLRCSQCSYLAEDVDDFLHHTEEKHGMMMRNNSEMETIRDILRSTDSNSSQQAANAKTNTNLASKNSNKEIAQSFTQETWETALKDIIAASGVPDSKLFRCTIEDCKTRLTESSYYAHVVYHLSTLGQTNINTRTYKCPHCKSTFNKPHKIKPHIKTHGVHKYFCYLCTETSVTIEQMCKHFEERHWRARKLRSTPLPYKTTDKQNSYYVLYTNALGRIEMQQFREKLVAEWQQKKSSSRTHFKPSEIGLLPLTPIFGRDLNCAVCPYKTKVRTNLTRHLQMHTDDTNDGTQHVSNVDPINPVPCLNSNEKHFDKMTNLASSSLVVGGSGSSASGSGATNSTNGNTNAAADSVNKLPYDYVPDTKRYTCGVSNCQYLTISDDIFRSHLNALHSDILNYNCPHCKEEICKRNLSIERILSHLRFHGPKLYQCEFCGYLHFMKNVVDRHTRQHDVHPPLCVKVIEYDRTKDNPAKPPENYTPPITQPASKADTNKSKSKQKWLCNLCGRKAATQQQMSAHASSQHSCKHQYKCVYCTFTAAQRVQVMSHIDENHAGKKREARYVYEEMGEQDEGNTVKAIDTRPLWLRDDPTRVRHIRGILMEDEEESERYSKRLCLDDNDEGTDNGDSDENLNLNEFGYLCYYCNSEFANPQDLREKHWQASTCKKFNAEKPFRYRICTQLKCPHCLSFVANSLVLMEHMKAVHRATKYLAADANATSAGLTCGHCEFRCQTLAHLAQHNARLRHKPFDLKCMPLAKLDMLKAQGLPLTYVQCLTCMELLADQLAFAVHVSLVHESTVNEIKSQKLQNILMYACPICQYASQQELAVLRHMIDHYAGFKRCYFCTQPQTTFNGYMQHCYSDHREAIKKFCDIYTYADISKFLQQLQLVFPNGLTIDLYNLRSTPCQYSNKHIKQLYDEIQKTSQQPPIPRLSLGRLVARKSIEAKLAESSGATSPATQETASASTAAALQLAGNYVKSTAPTFMAQKIMKRRSTVALGRDDAALNRFATPSPSSDVCMSLSNGKKRKIQQTFGLLPPTSASPLVSDYDKLNFVSVSDNEASEQESVMSTEPTPYSVYGKKPEEMDLNKIYIKIAAAETMETHVNISKFKLLYNIMPRVVVAPTDMTPYITAAAAKKKRKIIKPCPLSHKIRYA